jgi:hypothetical protein
MFDSNWFAKSIVGSIDVLNQIDILREEYLRFDQVWEGLLWLLARKSDTLGYSFRGYRLYKHPGILGDKQSPAITVLFLVGENEVEIVSLKISDPECSFENFDL